MTPLIARLVRMCLTIILGAPPPHLAIPSDLPDGVSVLDPYADMEEACAAEAQDLAPTWPAVWEWCVHRTFHSSRGNVIHSDVDGSWIHDRDRNVAWIWYGKARHRGRLDPANCAHHRVDRSIRHTRLERNWVRREWPWASRRPSDTRLEMWLKSAHDAERFGTRGPHDHNYPAAQRIMPGCWAPEALDRYDVAARLTVLKAVQICEVHGCRTKWAIKRHW